MIVVICKLTPDELRTDREKHWFSKSTDENMSKEPDVMELQIKNKNWENLCNICGFDFIIAESSPSFCVSCVRKNKLQYLQFA